MHSSRMRTGRSLTVCRSLLGGGGVGCLLRGSAPRGSTPRACVCSQRVCLLPGGVSAPRGCLLRGSTPKGGVCPHGAVCSCGGVCSGGCLLLGGGGGIPACTEADPPVNRMPDTSKNITLATTSLRPVINSHNVFTKISNNTQHAYIIRHFKPVVICTDSRCHVISGCFEKGAHIKSEIFVK